MGEIVLDIFFSIELFERLAHGFRKEHGGEDTRKHEERKELENVFNKDTLSTNVLQACETDLRDDRTQLSGRGRDTVRGGPVPRREHLSGDDEGGRVGAKVLEEVGEAVEEDEGADVPVENHGVVTEAHADEDDGEHGEAHELNWLSAPDVDDCERDPVSWNETGDGEDDVANRLIDQCFVDLDVRVLGRPSTEANVGQDDGRVESETIESDVEGKPRI